MTCRNGVWTGASVSCRVEYLTRNDNTYKSGDAGYKLYSE